MEGLCAVEDLEVLGGLGEATLEKREKVLLGDDWMVVKRQVHSQPKQT